MANFWAGVGQGFSGGFKRSWDAAARRRERREDREQALEDRQDAWDREDKLRQKVADLRDREIRAALMAQNPEVVTEAAMNVGGFPMKSDDPYSGELGYRSLDPTVAKGVELYAAGEAAKTIAAERAAEKAAIRTIELGSAAESFAEAGKAGDPFSKVYSPTSLIPEHLQKTLYNFGVNKRTVGDLEAKRRLGEENFKHFNETSKGLTGWFGDFVPSPEVMQTIPGAMIASKEIDLATQRKTAWDTQNEIDNKEGQFSRDEIIGMEPSALSVYIGELNRKKREESSAREVEAARQKAAATEKGRRSVQPTEDEALEAKFKLEKALVRIGLGLPIDASDEDVQAAKASGQGLPYKPVLTTDQFGFGKQIVIVPTGKGRITNEHVQQAKDNLEAVKGLSMELGKGFINELGIGGEKGKSKSDTPTPEKQETPMESEPSDRSLVTPFSDMDKSTAERSRSLKIGEQVQVGEEIYERVPEGLKLIKEAPSLPSEPIPPLPKPPEVDPLPPPPTTNLEIMELDTKLIEAKREYAAMYDRMMDSPIKKMAGTGEYEKAQALYEKILDLEAKIRSLKNNK